MNTWIATLATTNFRLVCSLFWAGIFIAILEVMLVLDRHVNMELTYAIAIFLAVLLGLDLTQFGIKRATFKPEAAAGLPVREATDPPRPNLAATLQSAPGPNALNAPLRPEIPQTQVPVAITGSEAATVAPEPGNEPLEKDD